MDRRPNILFLMTDEHRADVAGYEGNPVVRTPVLDELARTGVVFRNAYCAVPLCLPGRQCMMAGQHLRTWHPGNAWGLDLPPGYRTFARYFSQYAYQTVVSGKLHHVGPDQMQGWLRRMGSDDVCMAPQYIDGLREEEVARYAPKRPWTPSLAWRIRTAGVGPSKDERKVQAAFYWMERQFLNVYNDHPYLMRYADQDPLPPFLFKVSLLEPHYPFHTSEELFRYYLNRVQPFVDQEPVEHPYLNGLYVLREGKDLHRRDIRRATAAYYGMVENCDRNFGRILDRLRDASQDPDDWIIVYTSDHGDLLGEHASWEKSQFFEGAVRVPLVIRWPKRFPGGRVVTENVSHCDLFATLCELAGLPVPEGLDSRSLVQLLEGRGRDWNDEVTSELLPKRDLPHGAFMIKRGALKYHHYGPGMPDVLWDLARDPGETRNAVDDPAYAEEVAGFRARTRELGFPRAQP